MLKILVFIGDWINKKTYAIEKVPINKGNIVKKIKTYVTSFII